MSDSIIYDLKDFCSPVYDIGSNACDILMRLLRDCDQSWLTQWADSVIDWGAKAANSYFDYWTRQLDENQKMFLNMQGGILEKTCMAVSEYCAKPYDLTYYKTIEKEREITVDVPKVRKVGLFKKETYIDKEVRIENTQKIKRFHSKAGELKDYTNRKVKI